jgi:Pyridoxamine 5'-phosphate oxidase
MGKQFTALLPVHEEFIAKQRIFFVGSAPLSSEGHVNLSPKGYDSMRVLSPNRVAYLDMTGSGNETSAHIRENGRVTIMFCAFEGPPNILRLYGTGTVVLPGSLEWETLYPLFEPLPGARQIIMINFDKVQTSCGYSIPFMAYTGERETLQRWSVQQGEDGLKQYWQNKNTRSIDGLPTPLGEAIADRSRNQPRDGAVD